MKSKFDLIYEEMYNYYKAVSKYGDPNSRESPDYYDSTPEFESDLDQAECSSNPYDLYQLCCHDDFNVNLAVAKNDYTGPKALDIMSKFNVENEGLTPEQEIELKCAIAKHKNASEETLKRLANDKNEKVKEAVKEAHPEL